MNQNIHSHATPRQGTGITRKRKAATGLAMDDMTGLIIAAIAAALLAGLLVLPVTMPATSHHRAHTGLAAPDAPAAAIEGAKAFQA
ncbi:MAG: hypothetical protein NXH82_13425 [Rhodobacteraceae bacterium]|nr:hypothetical protein [Paracoccaceae bacterium]